MRIAAIDLGSNSIHMLIAQASRAGSFQVLDSEKDMIRLGATTLARGRLTAVSIRRALEVLRDYKRLAEIHRVDKIVAVATSAVREARNGEDFLDAVGRATGIYPKAISGDDEARLIYLAALHSIHLEGRRALVMDIGGGSLEVAVGTGSSVEGTISEKVGVLRLLDRFVRSDPISPKDERKIAEHVERTLGEHEAKVRASGFDAAIGTSGTILALGALACEMETGRRSDSLHHVTVRAESLRAVKRRLCGMDLRARLKIPGLDESRADIIVPGAVLLVTLLDLFGVKELTLSTWALREGILLNYVHRHPRSLARAEAYPDVRRRSVVELAERSLYDEPHARHTSGLAIALFDATRRLHGLADRERMLLEHASLLHDIGHHISHLRHHRHSEYLIRNGGLRGFDPDEIEILAAVARYHRQSKPKKKHPEFAALAPGTRRVVRSLAGILRVADALDRSHRQIVKGIEVARRGRVLTLRCAASENVDLEFWGARRRVALLEEVLGVRVLLRAAPVQGARALAPAAESASGAASAGGRLRSVR